MKFPFVVQMGSKYKKSIVSENVRKSLHGWIHKARTQHGNDHEGQLAYVSLVAAASTASLESLLDDDNGEIAIANDDSIIESSTLDSAPIITPDEQTFVQQTHQYD